MPLAGWMQATARTAINVRAMTGRVAFTRRTVQRSIAATAACKAAMAM